MRTGPGDLGGIVRRLDYLSWLGGDAVWLSPIFPSPMADFGYDVADYEGIDPSFGTIEDFDHLLAEAHSRGLRVIFDLGGEPHIGPAPLVPGLPLLPREPSARLVYLA